MNRAIVSLIIFLTAVTTGSSQEWITNIDSAKNLAAMNEDPILLVFQGSDWCVPCIKLEKQIWHSETFKKFASESLILLQADFPRKRKNRLTAEQQEHNNQLAEKYNPMGYFPMVTLIDSKGKLLGETGYKNITPEEYVDHLKEILNL